MIYSDKDIMDALDVGTFTIDPRPARDDISPSAVDLRLHNIFTVFDSEDKLEGVDVAVMVGVADTERVVQRYGDTVDIPVGDYLELKPGAFALGYTREHVDLPMNQGGAGRSRYSLPCQGRGQELFGPVGYFHSSDCTNHTCGFPRQHPVGDCQHWPVYVSVDPRYTCLPADHRGA